MLVFSTACWGTGMAMAQKLVVHHARIERDLKLLEKKYRSVRMNLAEAQRLLEAGLSLLQQNEWQGFGARRVFKARVVNSDINQGLSSGYRLVWEETDTEIRLLHIYGKPGSEEEYRIKNEVKDRLASIG